MFFRRKNKEYNQYIAEQINVEKLESEKVYHQNMLNNMSVHEMAIYLMKKKIDKKYDEMPTIWKVIKNSKWPDKINLLLLNISVIALQIISLGTILGEWKITNSVAIIIYGSCATFLITYLISQRKKRA